MSGATAALTCGYDSPLQLGPNFRVSPPSHIQFEHMFFVGAGVRARAVAHVAGVSLDPRLWWGGGNRSPNGSGEDPIAWYRELHNEE